MKIHGDQEGISSGSSAVKCYEALDLVGTATGAYALFSSICSNKQAQARAVRTQEFSLPLPFSRFLMLT